MITSRQIQTNNPMALAKLKSVAETNIIKIVEKLDSLEGLGPSNPKYQEARANHEGKAYSLERLIHRIDLAMNHVSDSNDDDLLGLENELSNLVGDVNCLQIDSSRNRKVH